jgi:uncharacterized protein YggL (DUF469 family)
MKKRLRKKKRVGEFREDGFTILAEVNVTNNSPENHEFLDDLIEFVESKDLGIGGGVGDKVDVFCTRLGRGTCTEDDRTAVSGWFQNHPLVTRFKIGPLVDAWYGKDEEYDLEFDDD